MTGDKSIEKTVRITLEHKSRNIEDTYCNLILILLHSDNISKVYKITDY